MKRILPMDGLRGIAVTLVFFVHYAALAQRTPGIGKALAQAGHHGVELFFVLSGYLIYAASLSPRLQLGKFLLRRARRIYPTFLAVFLVYLGLSYVFPAESKIPADPLDATLYLGANIALLPGLFPIVPMITVAWSLSYEIGYYLTCPALALLLRLKRWPVQARIAFWVLVAALGFACTKGDNLRAVLFVSGILVYECKDLRVPGWLAALLPAAALVAAGIGVLAGPLKFVVLFLGFGLLCISVFRGEGPARVLSWGPLRWLGEASYSYYLIHGLVLKALATVMPLPYWWMLVPAYLATIAGTAVLHYAVERPFSLAMAGSSSSAAAAPKPGPSALGAMAGEAGARGS